MPAPRTFWVLVAAEAGFVTATVRRLPPVVATHFDGRGIPNGWMGRGAYLAFLIGFGILLPLAVAELVGRAPVLDRRPVPPPPRARALGYWLGCLMAGLGLAIHLLILGAHRVSPPRLSTPAIVGLLIVFLTGVAGWSVAWHRARA